MLEKVILYLALMLIYFHIAGLGTTNILRLTKGSSLSVLSSKCICDNCKEAIPPHLQLPIMSYIICKGKCQKCGASIPVFPLILEIVIMIGMFVISMLYDISVVGIILSYIYYEVIRILTILIKGKRETKFIKSYIISVVSMFPFLIMTLFVSLIRSIV